METIMEAVKLDQFKTSDLYLAAFIKARGAHFAGTKHTGNGRMVFTFADAAECESLQLEFINNAQVSVGDFRRCLQDLKTEIFNR